MKRFTVMVAAALAAGCASAPETTQTAASDSGCTRESQTGSAISRPRCPTAEQVEAEKAGVRSTGEGIDRSHGGYRGPKGQ